MIIDFHAHTSEHNLWGLHTKRADLDELRHYAKIFGIDRIELMATYFPLKGTGLPNLLLQERIKGDKLFGFFGSLDLSDWNCSLAELEMLAEAKAIDGIKGYAGYQKFKLDSELVWQVCRLAQKYDLPIAVHMGELHPCCPQDKNQKEFRCHHDSCPLDELSHLAHPDMLRPLARRFPEVNFIACHLANPYFRELREAMRECWNISTDISGQFVSGTDEDTADYRKKISSEIHRFLEVPNGMDRVLFATDFPIQSYQDSLDIVRSLHLSATDEAKILSGNTQRLLKI